MEMDKAERVVVQNRSFMTVVPFWAVWPFETMVIPKEHAGDIASLSEEQKQDLADILIRLNVRYDNLFETALPYSMGFHQQPVGTKNSHGWHWHIHFLPPLLRSRSVKKIIVGYELMAMPQRDLTPESGAALLRDQQEVHYMDRVG